MLAVCAAGHTSNVQFVHSHHWSLFMGCWTKERLLVRSPFISKMLIMVNITAQGHISSYCMCCLTVRQW